MQKKLSRQYLDTDDLTKIVQAKVLSSKKEASLLNTALGNVQRHIVPRL
jgi:hypothetical protein